MHRILSLLALPILLGQVFSSFAQIPQKLDLSGTWKITWNEGGHGPQSLDAWLRSDPDKDPYRFLDADVPMELHKVLEKAGLVEDINSGMNTLKARWVEEKYWLYVKRFDLPESESGSRIWLVFDQLDLNADILINGIHAGSHHSAFIPCRIDVTGLVKPGSNLIQVGLESGLYGVAEKEGASYLQNMGALLNKRHWLRKPQYQFLWDWNPRLVNVGITGPVYLEWTSAARIDQVSVQCSVSNDLQNADILVKAFIDSPETVQNISLNATLIETGKTISLPASIPAGLSALTLHIPITNPKLWWPAGQGAQSLYHIQVELTENGKTIDKRTLRTGVRRIEIDQSPHPDTGSYFTILVNNRKIFMKGGNWVPPDMIYGKIDPEKLRTLTSLALHANFNMLRIWGGAIWAGHELLDMCDEMGLLIWHDLLFACSKYPGDDKEFHDLVKQEVRWGVREFSPHPSLAVWCGNNENEVGTFFWGWDKYGKIMPDYGLYHHTIPVIMLEEDPSRPYWPSSPYSAGHIDPNSPVTGDQHPWDVSLGAAGPDFSAYRNYVDRFPNEGGVLGASSPATLRQFLPPGEQNIRSFSWDHHDNEVNFWGTGPGVTYRATEFWLGKSAQSLGFDTYALASALLQAEGLTEYISNYRRRMFSTSSAIFWMYNDSWPVTHGWTLVDYYMRKKLAYHPVRRAYLPVSIVVVSEGDTVKVYGVNDSPELWTGSLRFGTFTMDGKDFAESLMAAVIPANCAILLSSFIPDPSEKIWDRGGAFARLEKDGQQLATYRLFNRKFYELPFTPAKVKVDVQQGRARFISDNFTWGVCIDIDGEASVPDNCFDLIPGIPYSIPWTGKDPPKVIFTGNSLFF